MTTRSPESGASQEQPPIDHLDAELLELIAGIQIAFAEAGTAVPIDVDGILADVRRLREVFTTREALREGLARIQK